MFLDRHPGRRMVQQGAVQETLRSVSTVFCGQRVTGLQPWSHTYMGLAGEHQVDKACPNGVVQLLAGWTIDLCKAFVAKSEVMESGTWNVIVLVWKEVELIEW